MDFINLKKQYENNDKAIDKAIDSVVKHGSYIMGPEVYQLENQLSNDVRVNHCVSCASGTDGLLMSLLALGVRQGDAVFVPSFTFISTAEVISLIGAQPIFVDIDEETFNININHLEYQFDNVLSEGKSPPKAVISVNMFGLPANYIKLNNFVKKYNLFLIEDCAQSYGASIHGERSGSFSTIGVTSFYPSKPLGCYGDGGAIFTNDGELADRLVSIRNHGALRQEKYKHELLGINGRLDTIQAAILIEKLKFFDKELIKRNDIASLYIDSLNPSYQTQFIDDGYLSSWAQFSILCKDSNHRKMVINRLKESSVPIHSIFLI